MIRVRVGVLSSAAPIQYPPALRSYPVLSCHNTDLTRTLTLQDIIIRGGENIDCSEEHRNSTSTPDPDPNYDYDPNPISKGTQPRS